VGDQHAEDVMRRARRRSARSSTPGGQQLGKEHQIGLAFPRRDFG
jgi:hypothetical protein